MLQRSSRFIRNFSCALGRGLIEQVDPVDVLGEGSDGILGVLAMAAVCIGVGLFFQIGYELMFDPNATDVGARLSSVSISPERWM
jgi:hypothetical protein